MMSKGQYRIDTARDNTILRRELLMDIEEEGRRIANVIWQPTRQVQDWHGTVSSGYVVVSEMDS